MQLDARRGDRGRVIDAMGREVRHVRSCDTETGYVEEYVRDADGHFILDRATDEAVTRVVRYPAPLRVVSLEAPGASPPAPEAARPP